jgi:hypothetical protein
LPIDTSLINEYTDTDDTPRGGLILTVKMKDKRVSLYFKASDLGRKEPSNNQNTFF